MRAVALSDKSAQEKIAKDFVPLKVVMPKHSPAFALDWPALAVWRAAYKTGDGSGFTGCSVVSPDLQMEYGSTGSAFIWEMFDSIAYDAKKFNAMLDKAAQHAAREREIHADKKIGVLELMSQLATFRAEVKQTMETETRFRLPPKGFTIKGAMDLFTLTGDMKNKE